MTTALTGATATKRILIVDDDVDIRETLSDLLEDEGYAVSSAPNGLAGLEYLRAHPSTSLVLLDLTMPVMDGVRFRAAQKTEPAMAAIPVVVMTARGPLRSGAIDVDDVLTKPLNLEMLMDTIHRVERPSPAPKPPTMPAPVSADWLADGGEMGALVRALSWKETELGPLERWPASLRTVVGLVLRCRFPMVLWWGPNLIQVYNDAYRFILGDKHPRSLGAPGSEVWKEIWPVVGPLAESIQRGGPSTWSEHLLLPMNRRASSRRRTSPSRTAQCRERRASSGACW